MFRLTAIVSSAADYVCLGSAKRENVDCLGWGASQSLIKPVMFQRTSDLVRFDDFPLFFSAFDALDIMLDVPFDTSRALEQSRPSQVADEPVSQENGF